MNYKSPSRSRVTALLAAMTAASAAFVPFQIARAQTTGFNQTGAGPFDYNNTANWVGGAINGIWDVSLTTTVAQTATFGADTTLLTGLNIGYSGNFDLTFRSDGVANRTVTLGGDLIIAPVSNRIITFGSTTANQGLNVNLGGNRTVTIGSGKTLNFLNTVSGGDLAITGNSAIAAGGTVKLTGTSGNAASSNLVVSNNATLQFDSSTSGVTGATRAQSVTLSSGGKLLVSGGNSGTNTVDTITGALIIDGSAVRPRSSSNTVTTVTVSPGAKNALLNIGSLQRTANGVALFRGVGLGANTVASATGGASNIQIAGTAPTLVGGGGAAGSTNVSIIPWAIGGTTATDAGSTFVTYTAASGIRALTAGEFATDLTGAATNNVALTGAVSVASPVTANSLLLSGANITGAGTINVTSGAVFAVSNAGSTIAAGLDFGAAEGVMGYTRGSTISGTIAGSGGLTVYGLRSDEALAFTNAASTYTGNTVVLANMSVVGGVLPSGGRGGDVYVYGNLQLSASGFIGTINGLFGNGTVAYGNSGASSLTIGDNNATSLFTGVIAGNSNLNIVKIGTGTASFTGEHTYAKIMSILGGTWEVTKLADGGVASGIGQSSSTATNLVISGGSLRYTGAATSTDRLFQVGQTTTGGTATIDASGTGAVAFTNTGALVYGTAGTTGAAQNRTLILAGTNTGNNTLSAIIGNNGVATNGNSAVSVVKNDAGTWVIAGDNTYTGTTTINGGTLALGASERIANTSNLVLAGGKFDTRGFSETLGTLSLTANSIIDLGAGTSSLVFADSSGVAWGSSISLSFVNFTQGVDSIRFGTTNSGLTGTQIGQITINGSAASIDANGYLSTSAIPEPSTYAFFAGAGLLTFAVIRRRKLNQRQAV